MPVKYDDYAYTMDRKYSIEVNTIKGELPSFARAFLRSINTSKQIRTQLAYAYDIRVFFRFLQEYKQEYKDVAIKDIPASAMNDVTTDDAAEYLSWLGSYEHEGKEYANTNVGKKRKYAVMRSFYHYLVNGVGLATKDPFAAIDPPKVNEKEIRILDDYEKNAILAEIDREMAAAEEEIASYEGHQIPYYVSLKPHIVKRDKAIMYLFLSTGMRVSELVGINMDDLTYQKINGDTVARVNITRKGGGQDHLFLSHETEAVLDDYIINSRDEFRPDEDNDKALFLSVRHRRISVRAIESKVVGRYAAVLGDPVTNGIHPHVLRATYASNYYNYTGDIYATASVLGHKSVETTRRHYAKATDQQKYAMIDMTLKK